MQWTCLRALERFDAARPGTELRAWLFTVLRHELISRRRSERRQAAIRDGDPSAFVPFIDPCPDLEAVLIERQWSEEIRAAVLALPETYRVPVYLKDVAGLSYREIAEVADCPIGTVMSRLARGRGMLRAALARQAHERGILAPRRERVAR